MAKVKGYDPEITLNKILPISPSPHLPKLPTPYSLLPVPCSLLP
ncbi:hypothetical protein [Moorena sp. SIO3H5]|nr:hypothetical protein [Moorena sp. SIO3H5]